MRRPTSIALAVLVLAVLAPAPRVAGAAVPLRAALDACTTGAERSARTATFTGSMPALDGAPWASMRFTLLKRVDRRWRKVDVPGWDRWVRAGRNAAGFVYSKRVEQLGVPATYRAQVVFRWSTASGSVRRRVVRTTAACRQPDLRPDLEVADLSVEHRPDGTALVRALVRNTGRGDVRVPFDVRLRAGEAEQTVRSVASLAAGATTPVSWTLAGGCPPGTPLAVAVDDADNVDERDERDGRRTVVCPDRAAAAGSRGTAG